MIKWHFNRQQLLQWRQKI